MTYAPNHPHTHHLTRGPQATATRRPGLAASPKSRVVGAVLQFVLGAFGAGRFYLGCYALGVAQAALAVLVMVAISLGVDENIAFVCSTWGAIDTAYILLRRAHDGQKRPVLN